MTTDSGLMVISALVSARRARAASHSWLRALGLSFASFLLTVRTGRRRPPLPRGPSAYLRRVAAFNSKPPTPRSVLQ
jgi:hypothetical protein